MDSSDATNAPAALNLTMRKRRAQNNIVPVAPMEIHAPPPPKRKRKVQDSTAVVSKQLRFSGTFRPQNWSLPDSIIYYICKNPPTTKVYRKMVQTCKYFYIENSIFVITSYTKDKTKWKVSCGKKSIDIKNITSRIWITGSFQVKPKRLDIQNFVSSIIPKIYQCDAKRLWFENQIISYQEFLFLASSVRKLVFRDVNVMNEDGTIVACEKLVAAMPKAKEIDLDCGITSKTFKEFLKLPHFFKLQFMTLKNISEDFDIEAFYDYMKTTNEHTKFKLAFNNSISEAYRNRLEEIIDEMIETENHDYKVPIFCFEGLHSIKFNNIVNLFYLGHLP